jgi:hypothetical protein
MHLAPGSGKEAERWLRRRTYSPCSSPTTSTASWPRSTTKHYLSDSEQFEEVTLKKRKLQLKDRMEEILRTHRGAAVTT